MKCAICEERKPRRHCPGVQGEICSACCGEGRENTIACPLDCVYLREARSREKAVALRPADIPFSDIQVPRRFVDDHEAVFLLAVESVAQAVAATPATVDSEVRDALESLIRTYMTLQSGLLYETRPEGAVAADIYRLVQQQIGRAHV